MQETALVFVVVAILVLLGSAATWLTMEVLFGVGLLCVVLGCVVGFPAGFYYHVVLFRVMRVQGEVPSGWYWNPTRYHSLLSADEYASIRPWFVLGAAGFVFIILGCMLIGLAIMVA